MHRLLGIRETLILLGRRQHEQQMLMRSAYRDLAAARFRVETAADEAARREARAEARQLRLCLVLASREIARLEPMIDELFKDSDDLRALCRLN